MEEYEKRLVCPNCGGLMNLSPYHDMHIVECDTCGYDDKDDEIVLISRFFAPVDKT